MRFPKKVKDPERFDIVIFKYPDDESQLFIKRLIGLPGETVEIRDGKVYIDGALEPLDDSFVPEVPTGDYGPYKVPENSYFIAWRQPGKFKGFQILGQHLCHL